MPIIRRLVVLTVLLAAPAGAQRHPLRLEDLSLVRTLAEPQLSPDGRWIAYAATSSDYAADSARTEVVLVPSAGGTARRLTRGSMPRWSPDGRRIAFMGGRGERAGVWVWDLAADSARFVARVRTTEHFLGHRSVKGFAWSPDGLRIAFTSADPDSAASPTDPRVVTRIMYLTRTGLSDDRRTHLYVVSADGGAPRQLTAGAHDEHSLGWSPDGSRLVFVSNRSADADANYGDDLWTGDVASGSETRLTNTVGTEFQPAWSPDGGTVAYLANVRTVNTKDSSPEDTHLYVMPAGGGASRAQTRALDRRVTELAWEPGGTLLFVASDQGATTIYRVDPRSGAVTPVVRGAFQAKSVSAGRQGAIAFLRGDLSHPAEVWTARADGSAARQVSREQDALLAAVELPTADSLWVQAPDGTPVQGWLMRPAGWVPGRSYPLVLYVHGGPHGMYGHAFVDAFALLAARGYGVLFLNPRGSAGYGQRFEDGTLLNWGGGDYGDLMAGLDAALARNRWIDSTRLFVAGHSYGGFMTNWIVTRTPRFRAAMAGASVSNLVSFYGTSVYPDLVETEFGGVPVDDWALLWQWSPLAHVGRVRTPVLFLNGEADNDVPITQAQEMFMALRKMGVEAQMVRYPARATPSPRGRATTWTTCGAWCPGSTRTAARPPRRRTAGDARKGAVDHPRSAAPSLGYWSGGTNRPIAESRKINDIYSAFIPNETFYVDNAHTRLYHHALPSLSQPNTLRRLGSVGLGLTGAGSSDVPVAPPSSVMILSPAVVQAPCGPAAPCHRQ
jgi:dipeptidyl aminopeptidase/acylaminoacyl peptidase